MATTNKAFKVKNGLDLQAYDTTISATAVDVFVYDTSKDSDGGAWRHRTQNTSWYNETLNTSTRGSRREFPAVAVIVVEANSITIYDGDDPSLPLWWSYVGGTANSGRSPFYLNTLDDGFGASVTALNGSIILGVPYGNTNGGFRKFDFIADRMKRYTQSTTEYTNGSIWPMTAIGTLPSQDDGENLSIVNYTVNDVAITALPNAPIDPVTGLPIPTIAVATSGGVSVVRDDGTVVDSSITVAIDSISFTANNALLYNRTDNPSTVGDFVQVQLTIPTADGFAADQVFNSSNDPKNNKWNNPDVVGLLDYDFAVGSGTTDIGFNYISNDINNKTSSMNIQITSEFNTGWMNGDIKLATLSDTDATNVTGSELVTNGQSPISSTSSWLGAYGNETLSIVSNALQADADATGGYGVSQLLSGLSINKKYTVTATVDFDNASDGLANLRVAINQNLSGSPTTYATTTGTHTFTFTPPSTNIYIGVVDTATSASNYVVISNISVRLAEEDRSINDNGLQVFGTVTKSAVATSADLVAYSGFSSSNYLQRPYNASLQFGTGDFCFAYWVKFSALASQSLYSTVATGTAGGTEGVAANTNGAGTLGFAVYNSGIQSGGRTNCGFTYTPPTTEWICVQNIRRNGVLELWVNGDLKNTAANTDNINDTNSFTRVGGWSDGSSGGSSSLALFRISATAPSPEQIAKIYEDEKFLFQAGAQATLYGSSDAVRGLAYDDDTNLLHVGTSDGRSVFQGLRRVDNTTDAVTKEISASNGLVADE